MAAIIAGERSGAGKTTVTLALLSYWAHRGEAVQSYKVGPDYIDPMFHARLTGRPCRNLDPVLTGEAYVRACFARHTGGASRALVEGVMGLFDGISWGESADFASTAHIARLLDLPVILVLDCSRLSGSVAALAHGYCSYDPNLTIAGVVLNRAGSDRHLERLRAALAPLALPVLGAIRRQDAIALPDRHLGLVPTEELEQWPALTERLAHLARDCFDWSRLAPLLRAPACHRAPQPALGLGPDRGTGAVARLNRAPRPPGTGLLRLVALGTAAAGARAGRTAGAIPRPGSTRADCAGPRSRL